MTNPYNRIETRLIHAGEPEPRISGAVSMPTTNQRDREVGSLDASCRPIGRSTPLEVLR